MRLFFRLLLWLSITVLSFQGSAAMAIEQAEAPAHETLAATAHKHHQSAEQNSAEHCGKHDSKAATSAHAKCTACATCCVGSAAPPSLTPSIHTPPLASSLHVNAEAAMTSFVPSALERPPRRLFA
jgi:hypothetical protein